MPDNAPEFLSKTYYHYVGFNVLIEGSPGLKPMGRRRRSRISDLDIWPLLFGQEGLVTSREKHGVEKEHSTAL